MDGKYSLQFIRSSRFCSDCERGPTAAFLIIMLANSFFPGTAIGGYTESFQTWSSTSAGAWQTKSLSGAPFNVPANAVVEVGVRNSDNDSPRSGGVRAVGSSLDRRFNIHAPYTDGRQPVVMHVQADSSSQIQHYAENTTYVTFVLLGYWTSGTYVELFDTFTAGASASWTDKNLCSYGVRASHVAEIVITNVNAVNGRSVGVRTNGSSTDRRFTLDRGYAGAFNLVSMFVKTDTSTGSTIEVYAQDDTDIGFNLVGYWSVAPGAYTEAFTDVGSPSASATWQDKDLTANGVPDSAIAEFVLANEYTGGSPTLGVRTNGSSLSRLIQTHRVTGSGATVGRMHVSTDETATIEWYHSDITRANSFYLAGYWITCDTSISYVVTDLGAVTSSKSSLGWHINSSENVAGFEEDSSGNPVAWSLNCGTFTSLGTLGGSYAESHGNNDADMVVGWSHNASGKRRAFRWTSGAGMVDLGTVSSRTDSEAQAVNASSEIVGTVMNFGSEPLPFNRLAFIYLPSTAYGLGAGMNSLGTLGGTQSVAMDINDSGRVVGGAQNASGYFRPFRWNSGTMTDLGTLGGDSLVVDHRAEAVNSSGYIAGRSYTAGGAAHAFYWNGTTMSDLGVLTGGTESWAFGINDSNVVVGTSSVTGGAFHAFIWDGTNGLRDLNNLDSGSSGWTFLRATDINNNGFITGWGTNGSGQTRAFLLTPTCNAGGGGSAAAASSPVLAGGSGVTDATGGLEELVVDREGALLASIDLVAAEPGSVVNYQVSELKTASAGGSGDSVGTLPGFQDSIALPRTLEVTTSALNQGSSAAVSLTFTRDEIGARVADPAELELHVLDSASGVGGRAWIPAGKSIGESSPTGIVGQSGFKMNADGSVDYWAVRRDGGTFAVGKPTRNAVESTSETNAPRSCGIGMISPLLACAVVTLLHRRSWRGSR